MECLIGIQCKDFVLVAADMTTTQSIIVMKSGKMFVDRLITGSAECAGTIAHFSHATLTSAHNVPLTITSKESLHRVFATIASLLPCYNMLMPLTNEEMKGSDTESNDQQWIHEA